MSAIGTKRTSASALHMSAFGGKADMGFALHMSAFDPEEHNQGRNPAAQQAPNLTLDNPLCCHSRREQQRMQFDAATARVHHAAWRRGGMADRGAGTAGARSPESLGMFMQAPKRRQLFV